MRSGANQRVWRMGRSLIGRPSWVEERPPSPTGGRHRVRAWKNLSRPPEPLTDRPRSPAVRRNHGKDAGLSTENRDQQRKPDGGLRARALLRRVVIRLFVVLAAAAGCLDIMAMSRLGGPSPAWSPAMWFSLAEVSPSQTGVAFGGPRHGLVVTIVQPVAIKCALTRKGRNRTETWSWSDRRQRVCSPGASPADALLRTGHD